MVEHCSIWTSLLEQGVPVPYVDVLTRLYKGLTGAVQTDRNFEIERGTRQGDPISPIRFDSCLEDIMRKIKTKWHVKKHGLDVEVSERLTNLRYADGLLLVGHSFQQA